MSLFTNASVCEDTIWTMRLSDWGRSLNRARINALFNGSPPYSQEELRANNAVVNVNDLSGTKLAHDARKQFYNAFMGQARFFTINVDTGPKWKRAKWSALITHAINKRLKNSLYYLETLRSTFANVVLHGIGPVVWNDNERWCPDPVGVEDVLLPTNTYLTFQNLPFIAVFRPYTAFQLNRLTSGPKRDRGWNMNTVKTCLQKAKDRVLDFGLPYNAIYSPEKMEERLKMDGGVFVGDTAPTIDAWDIYHYEDEGKKAGWRRKIILDANWGIGAGGVLTHPDPPERPQESRYGTRNEFLYDGKDRVYGDKLSQLVHFQFGDLSAVAPFRYHSVRSLGFLLYAVCHLQNRLHCKFNDALFEHMLQYLRVNSPDDAERALKINLIDKGIIDPTVQFVKPEERWRVDMGLVQFGLARNEQLMGRNASMFNPEVDYGDDRVKKATQVMAEMTMANQLVSAAIMQAYSYHKFQYIEICRRFCIENSKDPDVRSARLECLKGGVPAEVMDSECWEIEPEKIMGGGNKMLQMAVSDKVMSYYPLLDPESQRKALRQSITNITDNPEWSEDLVPEETGHISNSRHDAQLTTAALLMGLHVDPKTGQNHVEFIETLLGEFGIILNKIMSRGGMATPDELVGMQNLGQHIAAHIKILAQDKSAKEKVKEYGDALGKAMNEVKALFQRLQQQMQAEEQQGPKIDPKDQAKIAGQLLIAKAKAENTRESHAQRTSQRQVQYALEQRRDAERHQQELDKKAADHSLDLAAKAGEIALEERKQKLEAEHIDKQS